MRATPSYLTGAIAAELDNLRRVITNDISQRSRAKRIVADLFKAVEKGNHDAAARILNRGDQLIEVYPQAKTTFEKLRIDLNRRQEEQLRETCAKLEEYCESERIPLKGRPPKYTVDHLLQVELDLKKTRSKVGVQSLSTLGWSRIRQALAEERARLWGRPFDAAIFRDRLTRAYGELERVSPSQTGWTSLEGVYQILKQQLELEDPDWRKGKRLIAYYKDEFRADLSRLWQAQALRQLGSPHIEFSSIRDSRRAYNLIQPDHNVGSYGFLRPREV